MPEREDNYNEEELLQKKTIISYHTDLKQKLFPKLPLTQKVHFQRDPQISNQQPCQGHSRLEFQCSI